jgi:hypothetical protein
VQVLPDEIVARQVKQSKANPDFQAQTPALACALLSIKASRHIRSPRATLAEKNPEGGP